MYCLWGNFVSFKCCSNVAPHGRSPKNTSQCYIYCSESTGISLNGDFTLATVTLARTLVKSDILEENCQPKGKAKSYSFYYILPKRSCLFHQFTCFIFKLSSAVYHCRNSEKKIIKKSNVL